jgi:hypothetical protein
MLSGGHDLQHQASIAADDEAAIQCTEQWIAARDVEL